jgi:hypothetical protein
MAAYQRDRQRLAEELHSLRADAGLSGAELGKVPFGAPLRVYPLSGFRLYDDLVIIESIVGEQQLGEPDQVRRFQDYLALLLETASTGADAVPIIRRAIGNLR